jgi:hypothetical protein
LRQTITPTNGTHKILPNQPTTPAYPGASERRPIIEVLASVAADRVRHGSRPPRAVYGHKAPEAAHAQIDRYRSSAVRNGTRLETLRSRHRSGEIGFVANHCLTCAHPSIIKG